MPLTAPKLRTYTGRTPGQTVTDHDGTSGTGAAPVYVDAGGGDIAITAEGVAAGLSSQVTDTVQGDSKNMAVTMDFVFATAPSAAGQVLQLRAGTAPGTHSQQINVLCSVTGGLPTLQVRAGGTANTNMPGFPTGLGLTLALNTPYRLEVTGQIAAATTGKAKARVTRLSDATQLAVGEGTAFDHGVATWQRHLAVKVDTANTMPIRILSMAVDDTAYAYTPAAVDPPSAIPEWYARVAGAWVATDMHARAAAAWVKLGV